MCDRPGPRLMSVGDVFPNIPQGLDSFLPLRPVFERADVVVGNCEGVYADEIHPSPSHKHLMTGPTRHGEVLGQVPFHVMTCANNHIVDGGYAALRTTLELLRRQGIAVTGAGMTIEEAQTPAVIERAGLSIAALAFCSVFPVGYEARPTRPGLSPLRLDTVHADPDPNFWEPGAPWTVSHRPQPADHERFRTAIRAAVEDHDVVTVSFHWGFSSVMERLDDYELELAREAIDLGASAVFCHHQHSLRGVELRDGRPIYFGLGTLIHHFHGREPNPAELERRRRRLGPLVSFGPNLEYPLFPFQPDARQTGIAVIEMCACGRVTSAGLVPAIIEADGSTRPIRLEDPLGTSIIDYVRRMTGERELHAQVIDAEMGDWHLARFA